MIRRVVLYNLRSAYNVGAIMRTAEAFGVSEIICVGTTPFPKVVNDKRLPHEIARAEKQIEKTALGASEMLIVKHAADDEGMIDILREGLTIVLEQGEGSVDLMSAASDVGDCPALTLMVGEEVHGIPRELIKRMLALDGRNKLVEIPMLGRKESLNVSVAAGVALHWFSLQKRAT
ncbi:TrmH family RNA methyltransferase [Candidatus Saccharibacteria bacterium]|nr:TrmH family RNA methyltransferase [Candidatus Saccharibacteria bacterium]